MAVSKLNSSSFSHSQLFAKPQSTDNLFSRPEGPDAPPHGLRDNPLSIFSVVSARYPSAPVYGYLPEVPVHWDLPRSRCRWNSGYTPWHPPLLQKRTGTGIRTRHLHRSCTKPFGLVDKDEHTAHRSVETDELPGHTTHVHFPTGRTDFRVSGRTLKQGVSGLF